MPLPLLKVIPFLCVSALVYVLSSSLTLFVDAFNWNFYKYVYFIPVFCLALITKTSRLTVSHLQISKIHV
uniref:Putative ovule protein n=1 Tax=Solanum chacoense TaxID=4108 RepID=A0A0V0GRS8_SOLCH